MRQAPPSAPRTQLKYPSHWLGLPRLELRHLAIASYKQTRVLPIRSSIQHSGQPNKHQFSAEHSSTQYSLEYILNFGRLFVGHHFSETTKHIQFVQIAQGPLCIPRHTAISATGDDSVTFVLHVTVYHSCIAQYGLRGRTSICQGRLPNTLPVALRFYINERIP